MIEIDKCFLCNKKLTRTEHSEREINYCCFTTEQFNKSYWNHFTYCENFGCTNNTFPNLRICFPELMIYWRPSLGFRTITISTPHFPIQYFDHSFSSMKEFEIYARSIQQAILFI